jgi:hypothetical protein
MSIIKFLPYKKTNEIETSKYIRPNNLFVPLIRNFELRSRVLPMIYKNNEIMNNSLENLMKIKDEKEIIEKLEFQINIKKESKRLRDDIKKLEIEPKKLKKEIDLNEKALLYDKTQIFYESLFKNSDKEQNILYLLNNLLKIKNGNDFLINQKETSIIPILIRFLIEDCFGNIPKLLKRLNCLSRVCKKWHKAFSSVLEYYKLILSYQSISDIILIPNDSWVGNFLFDFYYIFDDKNLTKNIKLYHLPIQDKIGSKMDITIRLSNEIKEIDFSEFDLEQINFSCLYTNYTNDLTFLFNNNLRKLELELSLNSFNCKSLFPNSLTELKIHDPFHINLSNLFELNNLTKLEIDFNGESFKEFHIPVTNQKLKIKEFIFKCKIDLKQKLKLKFMQFFKELQIIIPDVEKVFIDINCSTNDLIQLIDENGFIYSMDKRSKINIENIFESEINSEIIYKKMRSLFKIPQEIDLTKLTAIPSFPEIKWKKLKVISFDLLPSNIEKLIMDGVIYHHNMKFSNCYFAWKYFFRGQKFNLENYWKLALDYNNYENEKNEPNYLLSITKPRQNLITKMNNKLLNYGFDLNMKNKSGLFPSINFFLKYQNLFYSHKSLLNRVMDPALEKLTEEPYCNYIDLDTISEIINHKYLLEHSIKGFLINKKFNNSWIDKISVNIKSIITYILPSLINSIPKNMENNFFKNTILEKWLKKYLLNDELYYIYYDKNNINLSNMKESVKTLIFTEKTYNLTIQFSSNYEYSRIINDTLYLFKNEKNRFISTFLIYINCIKFIIEGSNYLFYDSFCYYTSELFNLLFKDSFFIDLISDGFNPDYKYLIESSYILANPYIIKKLKIDFSKISDLEINKSKDYINIIETLSNQQLLLLKKMDLEYFNNNKNIYQTFINKLNQEFGILFKKSNLNLFQ